MTITEPGIYQMTNAEYHADPVPGGSLSSTGARRLIPPSCPAKFLHNQKHGQAHKDYFDLGHAAHRHVLGEGEELVVLDFADWKTKAAREARDEVRADGKVPLLAADHTRVMGMADAIKAHPIASVLFDPATGLPEQSLFWRDRATNVMLRARLDWLPNRASGGRLIVPDFKTTKNAEPAALQRTIANFGYHQQAAWYLSAVKALDLAGDREPAFVLVFQETEAPFVVTVVEPDPNSLRIGEHLNREAIATYVACKESGQWPAYSSEVELMPLPPYIENQYSLQELTA